MMKNAAESSQTSAAKQARRTGTESSMDGASPQCLFVLCHLMRDGVMKIPATQRKPADNGCTWTKR